jgi:hypothetical protein
MKTFLWRFFSISLLALVLVGCEPAEVKPRLKGIMRAKVNGEWWESTQITEHGGAFMYPSAMVISGEASGKRIMINFNAFNDVMADGKIIDICENNPDSTDYCGSYQCFYTLMKEDRIFLASKNNIPKLLGSLDIKVLRTNPEKFGFEGTFSFTGMLVRGTNTISEIPDNVVVTEGYFKVSLK